MAAIYSEAVGVPGMRRDRSVHAVGYPLPSRSPPSPCSQRARPASGGPRPERPPLHLAIQRARGAPALPGGPAGLARALPGAEVVLRPHPSQDLRPVHRAIEAVAGVSDPASIPARRYDPLLAGSRPVHREPEHRDVPGRDCGTPVAVLNVTGFDWTWPLGGDTPVPVATRRPNWRRCCGAGEAAEWPGQRAAAGARGGRARYASRLGSARRNRPHMTSPPATGRFAPVTVGALLAQQEHDRGRYLLRAGQALGGHAHGQGAAAAESEASAHWSVITADGDTALTVIAVRGQLDRQARVSAPTARSWLPRSRPRWAAGCPRWRWSACARSGRSRAPSSPAGAVRSSTKALCT